MNNQTLGDAIQLFFAKNGKLSLLLEQQAIEHWREMVGEFIANQTTKISAKQGVIYVTIPNAALRFELMSRRSEIITKINQKLGGDVIKGIIIK